MTEKEWLTSGAPAAMLEHCWAEASARKKRLFGCACCSRATHTMNPLGRSAVDTAERFADGQASPKELASAHRAAYRNAWAFAFSFVCSSNPDDSRSVWDTIANRLLLNAGAKWHAELSAMCDLLRDIFGNPFRPVALDQSWLTSDVLALARGIYDERAFDRMPILADALQDAGCTNEDALNHCRDTTQPHVRGCWVVDLVLGKT